jgi:hypothetical protein
MPRRFVTAAEVDDTLAAGRTRLEVTSGTIVTAYARSRAEAHGVALIEQEATAAEPTAPPSVAATVPRVPNPDRTPVVGAPPPPNPFTGLSTEDDPLRVGRWSRQKAQDWYAEQAWLVGCNYVPAHAVNQLEMWQKDTFDVPAMERELDLARSLGFNTLRVFLHDLLWGEPKLLLDHLDRFLTAADQRGIAVMPVFFDGVWHNYAHPGPQPDPVPGMHNSQWLQSPDGKVVVDPAQWPRLEDYLCGVLERFADDERVIIWDLYNEPGNEALLGNALPLLDQSFRWARSVGVSQPLISGIWEFTAAFSELNRFQLLAADLVSFHHYGPVSDLEWLLRCLEPLGRPILCTEYMARPLQSTFDPHLRVMRDARVGAFNWGLVSGRSQTIHPWGSPRGAAEPPLWFHDIFRPDGTPYDAAEVDLIRRLTQPRRTQTVGPTERR